MILNSNLSSIKEKQDFFTKLANKYFKLVFSYWLYMIIFTILFSTIALGLEIYEKGWNTNILLTSIIKFTLYIGMTGTVYFYHKNFKNKIKFYIYHDFFMFVYVILISFLQIYNCFYDKNDLVQSGKFYYAYADQSLFIFLYVPWMTIFNKKLKIGALFISDLLLIIYTTFIDNDLSNIEIFKSFLYFCFKICIDYKLSNIIIILIEDVYRVKEENRDDNLKWKRIIDEMPIGFIIISKTEKNVLFINNYCKELLDLSFEKKEQNIFDLVNKKIGQLTCLNHLQDSNNSMKISVMRESREAVKLLANDNLDQNKRYTLSEIFQFVTDSQNEANKNLLNDYLIYLETNNNDSKKLAIRIDRNTNFNEIKCFSIFLEDISLREANKALKKNYEFQSSLLKSFSHELKTPLNSSIPSLEMGILSLPQDEKLIKESFLPALKSMKLLQLVLNSIIDLNSINSRQFVLNVEKIKLQELILSLFALVEPQSEQKHLQLLYEIEEHVAEYLYTDYQRLSIILINLLTNAIKFTYSGKIVLQISKKSSRSFRFSVVDTGIGISEPVVLKMNELFTFHEKQQENSQFLYYNNSEICLGLNISNKLAHFLSDKNSGSKKGLSVESSSKGSIFAFKVFDHGQAFSCNRNSARKLSILLVEKNETRKNNSDTSPSLNLPSLTELEKEIHEVDMKIEKTKETKYRTKHPVIRINNNIKKRRSELYSPILQQVDEVIKCKCSPILIVDDDPFNQLSLELILKKFKLKCEKANHGLEAIEILKQKSQEEKCSEECHFFKLIFMDYQMPIMNGVEASLKIKELINQEIIDNVSIVGCTAFCTKTEVENFWKAKIDDLIIKPISMSLIQDVLTKWKLI